VEDGAALAALSAANKLVPGGSTLGAGSLAG
jgi:hypothetical protein